MIVSVKSPGAEFNLSKSLDIKSVKNSKISINKMAENNNDKYNENKIRETLLLVSPSQFGSSCICAGLWPQ